MKTAHWLTQRPAVLDHACFTVEAHCWIDVHVDPALGVGSTCIIFGVTSRITFLGRNKNNIRAYGCHFDWKLATYPQRLSISLSVTCSRHGCLRKSAERINTSFQVPYCGYLRQRWCQRLIAGSGQGYVYDCIWITHISWAETGWFIYIS